MSKPKIKNSRLRRTAVFNAYLAERGISAATADAAGLRSVEPEEHAELMQQERLFEQSVAGGLIPYHGLDGKATGDHVSRVLSPLKPAKGKKKPPKFLHRLNSTPRLYLPPIVPWQEVANDPRIDLLITEGPIKALAAAHHGFPCIGLAGVWNWVARVDEDDGDDDEDDVAAALRGNERVYSTIADFDAFVWRRRTVYVIFDSDAAVNPNVRQAEERLCEALYGLGARPFVVRLPGTRTSSKQGLDDLLATHQGLLAYRARRELKRLLDRAESKYVAKIVTAAQTADIEEPTVQFVIHGLLPTGLTLCVARPKVGKSFFTLQGAHAVATGSLAFGSCSVTTAKALVIALEDKSPVRIRSRLRRMGLALSDRLHLTTKWPAGDQAYNALARYLEDDPDVQLVVIDTWTKFKRPAPKEKGQRDQYTDDYQELGVLKAIADRFGVAIWIVHHVRKGKVEDVLESVLGSTAIVGAADTVMVLQRRALESAAVLHITGRDVEEQQLALEFVADTCIWRVIGPQGDADSTSTVQRSYLDLLREAAAPMPLKQIADAMGVAKPSARQMLLRLIDQGKVCQDEDGRYELVSPNTRA